MMIFPYFDRMPCLWYLEQFTLPVYFTVQSFITSCRIKIREQDLINRGQGAWHTEVSYTPTSQQKLGQKWFS